MKLRTALARILVGWKNDLSPAWRNILAETDLNFESRTLDHEMDPEEVVLPGRKRSPLAGATPGAHLFRALEKSNPDKVRVIILGQEPYANPAWATGRAFEQGNLAEWPENSARIANSLRRIVQVMAAARTGNPAYTRGDGAWKKLVRDLRAGAIKLDPPPSLFDRLQAQGVLFLNTSLTVSVTIRAGKRKRRRHHLALWEPLVNHVLSFIAGRQSGHAIFLLWGRHACKVFDGARVRETAQSARIWKTRVDVARHVHPAAITREGAAFLRPPNPFLSANRLLERMGAEPIPW